MLSMCPRRLQNLGDGGCWMVLPLSAMVEGHRLEHRHEHDDVLLRSELSKSDLGQLSHVRMMEIVDVVRQVFGDVCTSDH